MYSVSVLLKIFVYLREWKFRMRAVSLCGSASGITRYSKSNEVSVVR